MTVTCKHGSLARSCYACELEEELGEIQRVLAEVIGTDMSYAEGAPGALANVAARHIGWCRGELSSLRREVDRLRGRIDLASFRLREAVRAWESSDGMSEVDARRSVELARAALREPDKETP